ncbi:MAG: hypothetical protein ACFE8M_09590 [Candidatus Hermodarchaeota archaeon]
MGSLNVIIMITSRFPIRADFKRLMRIPNLIDERRIFDHHEFSKNLSLRAIYLI